MADSDVLSKCRDHSAIGREAAHSGLMQPLTTAWHRSADLAAAPLYRPLFDKPTRSGHPRMSAFRRGVCVRRWRTGWRG